MHEDASGSTVPETTKDRSVEDVHGAQSHPTVDPRPRTIGGDRMAGPLGVVISPFRPTSRIEGRGPHHHVEAARRWCTDQKWYMFCTGTWPGMVSLQSKIKSLSIGPFPYGLPVGPHPSLLGPSVSPT